MKQNYRQGDVFLLRIDSVPDNVVPKNNTVAYGEVTGHHHTFDENAQVYASGEQQYVVIHQPESVLTHQEHEAIPVPKGIYQVILQREYDVVEGVRRVLD